MLQRDPSLRPTAANALAQFKQIRNDVWTVHRLWRPRMRDEPLGVAAIFDTISLVS